MKQISRAENDNRYSRQSLLHLPDEKKTWTTELKKNKNLNNGDI
jgi:hypothetical protein